MPLGRTPITWNMTVRDALLNVINEDMEELFSRVEALELGKLAGLVLATEEEAIAGVDNAKAMTPLRTHQAIDAKSSLYLANYYRKDEDIYVSQGKVVDFADEAGDKIRLHGTQYGVAANPDELTLYAPSTSEIAVRDSAYNGQKLGEVIHTGNMYNKGVAKRLSMTVSTPGDHVVKKFWSFFNLGTNPLQLVKVYIPWIGTTRYVFIVSGGGNPSSTVYMDINTTFYGEYTIPYNVDTNISIDDSNTGLVTVKITSSNAYSTLKGLSIQTGNVDILHGLVIHDINSNLSTA